MPVSLENKSSDVPDKVKVLVVDDNEADRNYLRRILRNSESLSCDVNLCEGPEEARKQFDQDRHDLLVLDYQFPTGNGLKLYEDLKQAKQTPLPPSVLTTAFGDPELVDSWLELGGDAYLDKNQLQPERIHSLVSDLLCERTRSGAIHSLNSFGENNWNYLQEFLDSLAETHPDDSPTTEVWSLNFLHLDGLHQWLERSLKQDREVVEDFLDHYIYCREGQWLFGHYGEDVVWCAIRRSDHNSSIRRSVYTVVENVEEWLSNVDSDGLGNEISLCGVSISSEIENTSEVINEINSLLERATITPGSSVLIHSRV
ncbi:MAG: response regulator [bacterium]